MARDTAEVKEAPPAGPAEMETAFPVRGLHCASCVSRIEEALGKLPGVSAVRADLATGIVRIRHGSERSPEFFKKILEEAGYEVLPGSLNLDEAERQGLAEQKKEERRLLLRLFWAAGLSVPLLFARVFDLSPYTEIFWAAALQLIAAWHFHEGLWKSLKRRAADMNTLVSLSTWALFGYGVVVLFWGSDLPAGSRTPQWEALAELVTILTFGRWLEARTRGRAGEAVLKLMRLSPKTVRFLKDGEEETIPLEAARPGMIIRVKPGEQISLDGEVVSGDSAVNESLVTGESAPIEKSPGAAVWGGTMNGTGSLDIVVAKPGAESALARIIQSVRSAQLSKPRIQRLADKIAGIFVPIVLGLGAAAAVVWSLWGPPPQTLYALSALSAVFAVACPCALGLATPLAVIAGTNRAARMGMLVRDADVFEKAAGVDVVLFDKTGVLTEGAPSVFECRAFGVPKKELLSWALAAERRSEHPYAKAIVSYARDGGAQEPPVESFETLPGRGVKVLCGGRAIRMGSVGWLRSEGIPIPEDKIPAGALEGSCVAVAAGAEPAGLFVLRDRLRADAAEAVLKLKEMGLDVGIVSGDRREIVSRAAAELGIGLVYAETLPEEKAGIVAKIQESGRRVAVVGEGFNDAPALSRADLGFALLSGTDVAAQSADVTLAKPDLGTIARAIELLRRTRRAIVENLFWAFAYNLILIPVAAGALYPRFGILLRPQYAALAMAASSLSVVLNSSRLLRK